MMFTYMANFQKKQLPLEKIANNWIKQSKALKTDKVSVDKQNARIGLLAALKKEGNRDNISVLADSYTDDQGRARKRAVGLIEKRVRPRQQGVYVDTLIGNPKGDIDDNFSGTTRAMVRELKENYPNYGIQIKANVPEVSELYSKRLQIPGEILDGEYTHTGLIRDIPYV